MLVIRPLTTLRKLLALVSGMVAAAAIVVSGFPEPPQDIGKLELLLLLWAACAIFWVVLLSIHDALAKAQKTTSTSNEERRNGRA